MTREEAISFLSQVKEALLNNNSWDENTHNPITDSFDMAIKSLKEQNAGRWIPVTERLPEESGYYLCSIKRYYSDNYVLLGRFSMGKFNLVEVEAWMPLPKPYEEGSEKNDIE